MLAILFISTLLKKRHFDHKPNHIHSVIIVLTVEMSSMQVRGSPTTVFSALTGEGRSDSPVDASARKIFKSAHKRDCET